MSRFQRALDFFFARDRAVSRRTASRRLLIEPLESRRTLSTVPFYISDQTFLDTAKTKQAFSSSDIFVAMYAKDFDTTTHYYDWNSSGVAQETHPGTPIQSFALNSLTYNSSQNAYEIDLPDQLPDSSNPGINSARVYFSFGTPFSLGVNGDGTVNGLTGSEGFYYDFTEFTYNDPSNPGNLNIDVTNVDQFGAPMKITVDSPDSHNIPAGVGAATYRASIISQYQQFTKGTDFASDVFSGSGAYGTYRILSPGDALNLSATAGTFVDAGTVLQLPVPAGTQGQQQVITVASAVAFPDANSGAFDITVGNTTNHETMHVISAATGPYPGTTNWTVTRGANAQAWGAATSVQLADPAVSLTQTTLPAGSSSQFPSTYPFYVLVDSEVMKVTGLSADNSGKPVWTVERGQFGSTAATHDEGAPIVYDDQTNNPLNSYFNTALDALFTKYKAGSGNTLDLVSGANGQTYHGTVVPFDSSSGSPYVLRFHDDANPTDFYDVYYPFFNDNRYLWAGYTPSLTPEAAPSWLVNNALANYSPSEMVFLNNSVFQSKKFEPSVDPSVLGDLENQVVSALNRGVAQVPSSQWLDSSKYYGNNGTGQPFNVYAQFMHQDSVSIGGLAYGFAFDDQGSNASDISVNNVNSTTTTLLPWANDAGPGPGPGPGPQPIGKGFSQRHFMSSTPVPVPPQQSPSPSPVGQASPSATSGDSTSTSTTTSSSSAASPPLVGATSTTTTTKSQSPSSSTQNKSSSHSSGPAFSMRGFLSGHSR